MMKDEREPGNDLISSTEVDGAEESPLPRTRRRLGDLAMAGKIDRVRDVMSGIETSDTPAEEKPERLSRFNQGVIAEMSRQLGRGPARAA